jgi:hypothetical protein
MKALFLFLPLVLSFSNNLKFAKSSSLTMQDYSVYTTDYEIGGTNQIGNQMISKYFDSQAKVFKENDLYFLSITLLDNQALSDMDISVSDKKSGILEEVNGKKSTYTITLSYEDLDSEISLSGNVAKMGMSVSFTIHPNITSFVLTDEKVDEKKEYPARFVPELSLDEVGSVETVLDSYYHIPSSKATFEDKEIPVSVSVTSPSGENVAISEDKIRVEEIGEYTISFKASVSDYKTNLGNDSYALETITLKSNALSSGMVKIKDENNVLPSDYIVQCQRIQSGSTYDKVSRILEKVSDNYEITNIALMDKNGEDIHLNGEIECYIQTDPNYDRNKLKVYYLNGDNLELVTSSGYGRYVRFASSRMGTYVVLMEGVKTTVNLPLILSLSIGGTIALIALVVFLILFLIRRKKKS